MPVQPKHTAHQVGGMRAPNDLPQLCRRRNHLRPGHDWHDAGKWQITPPVACQGSQVCVCLTGWDVLQVFVESGEALVYAEGAEPQKLQDGDFYGEEPFITTLSMMVEENCALTVEAAANTQRKQGLKAVSDCHCLELGIKDVFEAFGSNRNVLRLLTRFNTLPELGTSRTPVTPRIQSTWRKMDAAMCLCCIHIQLLHVHIHIHDQRLLVLQPTQ